MHGATPLKNEIILVGPPTTIKGPLQILQGQLGPALYGPNMSTQSRSDQLIT